MKSQSKSAQQTTREEHASHNNIQVTHPSHPLTGQTVEVVRPYRRKDDQTYWDIALPDGTRAFLPETWTEPGEAGEPSPPTELDAQVLLQLARMVAQLRTHSCAKGAPWHEQPEPVLEPVLVGATAASDRPARGSQPEATPQPSGGPP